MARILQRDELRGTPWLTGGSNTAMSYVVPFSGNGWLTSSDRRTGIYLHSWRGDGSAVWNHGQRSVGETALSTFGQIATNRVLTPHMAVGTRKLFGSDSVYGDNISALPGFEVNITISFRLPRVWPSSGTQLAAGAHTMAGLMLFAPLPTEAANNQRNLATFAPCVMLYFAREGQGTNSGRQGIWLDYYTGIRNVEPDSRGLTATGQRGLLYELGAFTRPVKQAGDGMTLGVVLRRSTIADAISMRIFLDGIEIVPPSIIGDWGFNRATLLANGIITGGESTVQAMERRFGFLASSYGQEVLRNTGGTQFPSIHYDNQIAADLWSVIEGTTEQPLLFPEPSAGVEPTLTTEDLSDEGDAVETFPLTLGSEVEIAFEEPNVTHPFSDATVASFDAASRSRRRWTIPLDPFDATDLAALESFRDTIGDSDPFFVTIQGDQIAVRMLELRTQQIANETWIGTITVEESF